LLVLMFFGVLEMGMVLRTRTAMTDASREAARTAAALPRVDGFQNNALAAVNGVIANNRGEPIDYVVIYRADPNTGDPLSGEAVESCFTDCWRYERLAGNFQQKLGATWNAADQSACGGVGDTDWLAVYIRGHYRGVTPMLTLDRTFTDRTVMRLEPMELDVRCRP
ncbi:MAG: TadE/TadG family type IV pilus assembly protein, partial [Acidimicrobiales bacterium]